MPRLSGGFQMTRALLFAQALVYLTVIVAGIAVVKGFSGA